MNQFQGVAANGVWRLDGWTLPAPEFGGGNERAATAYVRPHEVEVLPYAEGGEGLAVRLNHAYLAGPSAFLELSREGSDQLIEAQVPEGLFRELNLREGEVLLARPRHARIFARDSA